MEVSFREFRRGDIDALFYLDERCYPPDDRIVYHQLVSTLLAPEVAAVVAEATEWRDPGVVAALIVRSEPEQARLNVVSLMVEPALQRRGLGRRLLRLGQALGRAQGLTALAVPVAAGNEGAAAFLAACGLEDTGRPEPFFADEAGGSVWQCTLDGATPPQPEAPAEEP